MQDKSLAEPGPVYTIGHSSLEMERFIDALTRFGVSMVVDVRSVPFSKFAPGFNRDSLERSLEDAGIGYRYGGDYLGGRPTDPTCYKRGELPETGANYLEEVDYEEVARRPWFRRGLNRVIDLAGRETVALMCSEEDPALCHRYHLIAQALLPSIEVFDIRTSLGSEPKAVLAEIKPRQISLF